MTRRSAGCGISVALLLCAALFSACAPARVAPGQTPVQMPGQMPEETAAARSGADRLLALALFHLREDNGLGPLAALKALDERAAAAGAGSESGQGLALRALALRLLERNEEAVAALDRLILLGPARSGAPLAEAFVERGKALASLGHQVRAAEDFEAALALDPRHVPALMARADQLFALGSPAEAEAWYTRVIEAAPESALAFVNRGVARDEQGRFAEAIADFTRALALDPGSPAAFANRGVSRSQAGDMAGMCADYRSACRLGACRRLGEARAVGYCPDGQ